MTARFRMPDAKARLLSIETTAREQHIPLAYGVSVDRWIPVAWNPAGVRVAGAREVLG